ncbi:MAG: AAA family ATPase [Mycobacterium sp.]|uniref:AAA family ATPase n=1 Tax=Mycobacterium sp. TaxID=1785 RepID=UPI003BB70F2C
MPERATPVDFSGSVTETLKPLPEILTEADRDDYESELRRLLINEAARTRAKQERLEREAVGLAPTPAQRLEDMFATEPVGEDWLIDGLFQSGGSVLLSAQYKSGKSTLAMNVVHALTTGKPFLGTFGVPEPLRVAYYDLELGFRIARKWFQAIQPDPEMATYTDLKGRGYELDLRSESWATVMIEQLRRDRIDVVVIDPISAVCAAIGVDENANAEVRPLLDRIDAVVREAGCKGALVVHHTGHDGSRFRGATAFGDWATAIWTLERKDDGPSRLGAKGRDVSLSKVSLSYDDQTRLLAAKAPDHDGAYFWGKRGSQLTAACVELDLSVTRKTAIERLRAADGWNIVQKGEGSKPDLWEYSSSAFELDDPWSTSSSSCSF